MASPSLLPTRPRAGEQAASDERLLALSDRADITGLIDRFALGLDHVDPEWCDEEWYRSLFTQDVRLDLPNGTHHGIAGLPEFLRGPKLQWARTQHLTTNCVVDVQGDRATARANVQAVHVPHEDSAPLFVGGAHYDVRAERTAAGWRIPQLTVTVLWTAEGRR
ncbi:nuclear transport factor 2 family protein (plasmid) [Streptomyces sp. NBC_01384]|uniref:nuclear transport factor 2 family protein n=1 Tax=Streptomyces sp. NBC_01384 TaxID=2903847 RepID=UPI002F910E83